MRSSVTEMESVPVIDYSGFVGLHTQTESFHHHVMHPEEVIALFSNKAVFDAVYAYPRAVANAFREPPVFSARIEDDQSLLLQAENTSNDYPRDCLTWFATRLLPAFYIARDRIKFVTDNDHGFGPGTCRITTEECIRANGSQASFAKKLIAVLDRPALFLKIRGPDGNFYPDVAIFFPDQAVGKTHGAVKYGEAFVLVKEGAFITQELMGSIIDNFKVLVNTSHYTSGNNLYSTLYKTPIEEGVARVISERNRLD